jgi:hypothetical protein
MGQANEAHINLRCSSCGVKTAHPVSRIREQGEAVCPRCGAGTTPPEAELPGRLAQAESDWLRFWCDWDELPEPVSGEPGGGCSAATGATCEARGS